MEVKLSVNLTAKEMFDFMIKHTYGSISGYIGIILSACALIGFIMTVTNPAVSLAYKCVLLLTALLFTVIQPVNLYLRSKKQVKENENINKPMIYKFTEQMIEISQGEDHVEYEWSQLMKVTSTKKCIFLYVSKFRAFIIPKRTFAEGDMEKFRNMVRDNAVNAKSVMFGK